MAKRYDIAVVGAGSLVAEAILDLLAQRKFPVGKLYALEVGTDGEHEVASGGETVDVERLEHFDFSQVQLAFFAADETVAAVYVPKAVAAGCVVIDDSAHFRQEQDVPLVVAEVNPQAVAHYRHRGVIANPSSNVTQLLLALKPLHDAATITRLDIATYQSVSGVGRKGVEELARQTAQLLNARPVEAGIFPKQMAFNLLPQIGDILDNGYSREEMKMVWEIQKVLDAPQLPINPTAVRVPVFFGHAAVVHLAMGQPLAAAEAMELLRQTAGLQVFDGREPGAVPTPVTEATTSETVFVGRIRTDPSRSSALNLWVVADNVRRGAALNAVQIAEVLVRDYWQDAG